MGLPAFRSAGDPADPAVLLVHGYPASSHMWGPALAAIAARGLYAVAPDLPGFGDSEPGPAGTNTWTGHIEALEALRQAENLGRVALVGHDWGGLIGLRWACDHPDALWAIVASDTGFFADGRWHGMADALRTAGQGEQLVDGMTLEAFTGMLGSISKGIGPEDAREYFKAFADEPRRRGQLELYRSGDFSELEAYDGRLAALGVPFLALWGEDDPFAPVAGAHRFARELPDTELVILDGARHFVFDDEPARCSEAVVAFLERV
jgi:haloalkane dehalogenase